MEEMKRSSIDFEEPKNSKSSSSRTHDAKASSSRRVESDGENPREDMKVEKQSQSITGEGKMKFGKDIETWLSHIRKKPNLGRAFLAEVKSKDVRTRKGRQQGFVLFSCIEEDSPRSEDAWLYESRGARGSPRSEDARL